jgi:hypothetical protein
MVYNSEAPQTFWVNNQDELITSDTDAGQTRTQLDNQFIWMTNYDSIAKILFLSCPRILETLLIETTQ